MTTIRFGSSTGPSLLASTSKRTLDVDPVEKTNFDPDQLQQCPFDKSHQIRACRLSYHLLKCKQNHPKLAKELKTCPFNACHLLPRHELARHTETCPNRISVGVKDVGAERKWDVPVRSQFSAAVTEDWENELDEAAPPFIWGQTVVQKSTEAQAFKTVGANFRGPTSLPW
ncbi:gametocyte-specific factor 1 isoform X1 [Hippocampus zosterae]|uniref:gametocyte-specific factor 1 isoform X1 n=1 Tax=Hippocampus zosterae TaxID=109293 RepID=UPI00223E31A7|nr:gametocyte-specific factor 1 isoform X1 [Hippocampus zosterae]